jgi:hypothetical protein
MNFVTSIHMNLHSYLWTEFDKVSYLSIFFLKIRRKIQVSFKSDKKNGHFI